MFNSIKLKNFKILSFFCAILLFSAMTFAANDKDAEIPPWMEDVSTKGRSTYLIPKGAKKEKIGSQIIVEPPNEYVARRIYEIEKYLEERFALIKKNQEELKGELEEIKKALNEVQKEQEVQKDPQGEVSQQSE